MWQPRCARQASVKSKLGLIYATLSHQRLAQNGGARNFLPLPLYTRPRYARVAYMFIANRRKPPQTTKIATYASYADPNFRL